MLPAELVGDLPADERAALAREHRFGGGVGGAPGRRLPAPGARLRRGLRARHRRQQCALNLLALGSKSRATRSLSFGSNA